MLSSFTCSFLIAFKFLSLKLYQNPNIYIPEFIRYPGVGKKLINRGVLVCDGDLVKIINETILDKKILNKRILNIV